jgi:hypothetical protein
MKGDAMRISLALAVVMSSLASSPAATEVEWLGGEGPPFVFFADGRGSFHPGDTLAVVVSVGGRYYGPAQAMFHLTMPPQLGYISGDTSVVLPLEKAERPHTLFCVPKELGSFEIRGRLRIDAREQQDVAEFTMPIVVREDTVLVDHSRATLLESRRKGQRYRYGDWWLIPLEDDEVAVVEADVEKNGRKARAVRQEVAACAQCLFTGKPDTVSFLAVIDGHGKVRDVRVMGSRTSTQRPAAAAIASAKAALQNWQFEPAAGKGHAVSDWIYVRVPVVPPK